MIPRSGRPWEVEELALFWQGPHHPMAFSADLTEPQEAERWGWHLQVGSGGWVSPSQPTPGMEPIQAGPDLQTRQKS